MLKHKDQHWCPTSVSYSIPKPGLTSIIVGSWGNNAFKCRLSREVFVQPHTCGSSVLIPNSLLVRIINRAHHKSRSPITYRGCAPAAGASRWTGLPSRQRGPSSREGRSAFGRRSIYETTGVTLADVSKCGPSLFQLVIWSQNTYAHSHARSKTPMHWYCSVNRQRATKVTKPLNTKDISQLNITLRSNSDTHLCLLSLIPQLLFFNWALFLATIKQTTTGAYFTHFELTVLRLARCGSRHSPAKWSDWPQPLQNSSGYIKRRCGCVVISVPSLMMYLKNWQQALHAFRVFLRRIIRSSTT